MGFLSSVFGDNWLLSVFVALAAVLVLIILGVWALKLVFNATGRAARGRAKRLGIVDITPVDQKRTLVLVRRDSVEHLLLIGGAQDLVIETRIAPEQAAQRPPRPIQPAAQPQPAPPLVAAPPPAAPTVAPVPPPVRPRSSNLPPDFAATRVAPMSGRNSLRHTALVRPPERQEPEFVPVPPPPLRPAPPRVDLDRQPQPDAGPGAAESQSDMPDQRGELETDPQPTDPRPDETREGH